VKPPISTWVGGPPTTPCGYRELFFSIGNSNQIVNTYEVMEGIPFFSIDVRQFSKN